MKKLSKLIITQMNIRQIPCYVCAYEEDGKVMELRFEPVGEKSSLGNIYVGQIENIAANIGAAFVQISAGEKCYLQLSDAPNAIYASVKKGDRPLKAGDEILVQISREAMKGKLPAVTTNLNFTGKYLVLTTGDKKFGLSSKLSNDDRSRISKWMEAEVNRSDKEFGIIVRTNAADASKEEILKELEYLKGLYHKAAVDGRSRTCFSCVYRTEPFYISAVRDANSRNLEEIITDIPEISRQISDYLNSNSPEEKEKLRVSNNLTELDAKSAKELVAEGKKGITADFNGVISKSAVQQGAAVTQGMELFTLQNTDKVSVDINVSKYDYAKVKEGQTADITIGDKKYTGKVTKISHIATTNEKGSTLIAATVSIDKPDKDIFLGVDAKVKIYAEKAEDVVTLPAGVVNIGKDGSFCYVLKDGVITKQDITTGISSEDFVEITDGIRAGDEVIEDLGSLEEGMTAEAAPADVDSAAETGETANE